YDPPQATDGAWLASVPYGGGAPMVGQGGGQALGGVPAGVPQGMPGPAPIQPYDTNTTAMILIGGLILITGGGALLGWFISGTRTGALVGALGGLGYSAANLAWNTSQLQGRA